MHERTESPRFSRAVYIYDLLKRRHDANQDSPYVFPGYRRKGRYHECYLTLKQLRQASGCDFIIHDCRRSFLTMAERLDTPHYALKELAGHSIGEDITGAYLIVDVERLRPIMQKITDRFLELMGVRRPTPAINSPDRHVIVRFVAVHERFSVCGIFMRCESEKAKLGHGRFAPIDYHDDCYRKLLDTAVKVEQQGKADSIEVYTRGADLLFQKKGNANRSDTHTIKAEIEKERSRPMTAKERQSYEADWENVFHIMDERKAPKKEASRVRKIAEAFLKE